MVSRAVQFRFTLVLTPHYVNVDGSMSIASGDNNNNNND